MPRLIFWDVDTQYDFMMSDGKLYVPGSEEILDTLGRLTDYAHEHHIPIVASADDHETGHPELSDSPDWRETFPPHCMRGSGGEVKVAQTALRDPLVIEPDPADEAALAERVRAHRGDFLVHKHRFDVFSNPNTVTLLRALDPEAVVLYGVALDVCNRFAIEGLLQQWPQAEIYLVTDAVRAIRPEEGERLVADWANRGVRMVKSSAILDDRLLDSYLGQRTIGIV
ncbi:MAG: cysteine hydrolase [Gemmatimonadota bacterium]|nr:cysteine hydrolase [Gemmatimonadota bacterium]